MRPLHALLVVVALAVAGALAWLLIRTDDSGGAIAPAARQAAASPAPAGEELAAPLVAQRGSSERVAETPSAPVTRPESEPAAASATAQGATLTGRVVDGAGRPVEGARVIAAQKDLFGQGQRLDEIDLARAPWLRAVETSSAADGRFALEVGDRAEALFAVRRSGFAPHDATVALRAGAARDLGDVTLEPSVVLEGRVVDGAGRGIAGASLLRARERSGLFIGGFASSGAELARSDERGAFRVDQLAAGPWKLHVRHDLHPDAYFEGQAERPGDVRSGLELVLGDGHAIGGRLLGAPAELAGKIEIVAWPVEDMDEPPTRADAPPVQRRIAPGADGAFLVQGLRAGERYRLQGRAAARGFDPFGRSYTDSVVAEVGARDVDLQFRPETALAFQVVDDASGAPITEFEVSAGAQWPMPLMDDENRLVRQHPEGRVRFGNLNADAGERVQLRIEATGYARFERADIALAAGRDNDLGVIRLEPAPVVTVRVVADQGGRPVEGARVRLTKPRPARGRPIEAGALHEELDVELGLGELDDVGFLGGGRSTRTDAEGVARLTSQPGEELVISVRAEGFAPYASAPVRLPEEKSYEHDVRLLPAARVVVRVLDSAGVPVAGVSVEHEGPDGPQPTVIHGGGQRVTDAAGELEFADLAAGKHAFRPGSSGGEGMSFNTGGGEMMSVVRNVRGGPSERSPDWVEVELAAGALETVVLTAPTRTELAGVISEAGRPLAGATVKLQDPDAPSGMAMFGGGGPEARTNGKGEYALDGVEVGRYRLEVTHPSRAMPFALVTEVEDGGNELDVDLPLTGIEGVVVDSQGEPLAGARVVARASEGGQRRAMRMVFVTSDGNDSQGTILDGGGLEPTVTDAEGHYELRGVTPDVDLIVEATHADAQPARSEPLRVSPGEIEEGVDLKLEPGGRLSVVLERPDGSGGSMHLVTATFVAGGGVEPKTGFTDGDGRASFDGLRPGAWKLEFQAFDGPGGQGSPIPPREVEVVAGENPPTHVTLP